MKLRVSGAVMIAMVPAVLNVEQRKGHLEFSVAGGVAGVRQRAPACASVHRGVPLACTLACHYIASMQFMGPSVIHTICALTTVAMDTDNAHYYRLVGLQVSLFSGQSRYRRSVVPFSDSGCFASARARARTVS